MEYPKPIMRLAELMDMGFPKEYLMVAYRTPEQNFASKINPYKENSPIIFETTEFEKWRLKRIKAQTRRKN